MYPMLQALLHPLRTTFKMYNDDRVVAGEDAATTLLHATLQKPLHSLCPGSSLLQGDKLYTENGLCARVN